MIPVKYYYSSSSSAPTASSLGAGGILFNSNNKYIYFTPDGTNLVTYQGTDKRVSMTRSTTSSYRALLMHPTYGEYGTDPGSATSSVYYHENIMASPQNGSIKATKFIGELEGNADTATSANKLNTDGGNVTQPVYFSDGKPVACSYTLSKSVPPDAVFTDTTYNIDRIACKSFGLFKQDNCPVGDVNSGDYDNCLTTISVPGIVTKVSYIPTSSTLVEGKYTINSVSISGNSISTSVTCRMTQGDQYSVETMDWYIYYIPVC